MLAISIPTARPVISLGILDVMMDVYLIAIAMATATVLLDENVVRRQVMREAPT
jgi:hypothetical protein